jgi:hypothetical protein
MSRKITSMRPGWSAWNLKTWPGVTKIVVSNYGALNEVGNTPYDDDYKQIVDEFSIGVWHLKRKNASLNK